MELTWLRDFIVLKETGSFSRASEMRHVTQPAFSRRIRSLENWVGLPLFQRTPKGVHLTAAGAEFAENAEDLVRRIATLRRKAREAGGMEIASLRFAATHALSFSFFPQWVRSIELQGAVGPIKLISDSMQACEDLMLHGDAQFLLCHYHAAAGSRFASDQFRSIVVGRDALAPYVAPDDSGEPLWTLANDGDIPHLEYSDESGLGRIFRAQPLPGMGRLRPVFTSHLAAALLSMARNRQGIAWLPQSLATRDIEEGRIVPAGDSNYIIPLDITVFRPSHQQARAIENFWSELEQASNQ